LKEIWGAVCNIQKKNWHHRDENGELIRGNHVKLLGKEQMLYLREGANSKSRQIYFSSDRGSLKRGWIGGVKQLLTRARDPTESSREKKEILKKGSAARRP